MPFIKPDCILRDYVLNLMTEQINYPLNYLYFILSMQKVDTNY